MLTHRHQATSHSQLHNGRHDVQTNERRHSKRSPGHTSPRSCRGTPGTRTDPATPGAPARPQTAAPQLAPAATYVCCISEWAVADVGLWLSGPLQLPTHVAAAFTAAGVDGRALAALR